MPEDSRLLCLYAKTGDEAAFTTLVQRYLPLVHSAALRQTGGDLHQAKEMSQTVFILLARKAAQLQQHPALDGWLYTTTYHAVAKARRADQRRRHREQEVHAMHDEQQPLHVDAKWAELRPVVDEMMLQLKEEDRTAVLWRFFENHTHGEIGARLGISENAARMRVDRALDALRTKLARRGIISTVTALGATLSSQAVMTPPAGLAASISFGALAPAAAGGGFLFFMNSTLFKAVALTAVIGASTGGLIWERQKNVRLQTENSQLRSQLESPTIKPPPAATSLVSPSEASALLAQINALRNSATNSWQERASLLGQLVKEVPELNIPEIQLATEEDWLDATKEPMETEADYRRALAKIRNVVIGRFAGDVRQAINQFVTKTGGRFPTDPAQLEPYLEHSIGTAVWRRYEIQPASAMPTITMGGDWILTQKTPIDADYDAKFVIGPYGIGTTPYQSLAIQNALAPVMKAYVAANPGKKPSDLDQLLPFASTPEQRAAVEKQKERLGRK